MQGSNMAANTMPAQGFFEKHRAKIAIAAPNECWHWTASKVSNGYGQVRVGGRILGAHRQAYEAENGAGSADGLVVRHRCDVPQCVNPRHLETGTQADNVRDREERGRSAKGETNGNSKLTESDAIAIRAAYVYGSSTHGQVALATRFGVDQSTINGIIQRKLWGHVT